jgi:hypothetical protein
MKKPHCYGARGVRFARNAALYTTAVPRRCECGSRWECEFCGEDHVVVELCERCARLGQLPLSLLGTVTT